LFTSRHKNKDDATSALPDLSQPFFPFSIGCDPYRHYRIFGIAKTSLESRTNFTPASAEKGYLSAARFMSPELLSRFEPVAREQLKQVVTNRVSQFFTVDSYKIEGKDPPRRQVSRRTDYVCRKD
jgi:hypothetical protein